METIQRMSAQLDRLLTGLGHAAVPAPVSMQRIPEVIVQSVDSDQRRSRNGGPAKQYKFQTASFRLDRRRHGRHSDWQGVWRPPVNVR